ncbi:MAG: cytochrome c5 family protein [Candidimonas sp.]|nr:MAG: cytochrome c5 family protein [Candidimonas sp.]TAM23364.1 MAG: cytochrome c5 family protein [Candidimonas sp.]TAM77821.1 MAG: cytochrome c5 family protein [Candidimonas sp.]
MDHTEENNSEHIEEHAGLIKTPKQLIVTVILAFLIPISVLIMLAHLVTAGDNFGAGSDAFTPAAIAARLKPVASLDLVDANAPKVYKTGQQVFESTCTACHTAGVAGAPKIGNSAAWAPFIKTGYDAMIKNALHGIGAMPPKGGNPSLSDYEIARAVAYMANKSGASFKEPPAPAAKGKQAAAKPEAVAVVAAAAAAPAVAPAAPAPAAATPAPAAPAAKTAAAPAAEAAVDPAGEKLYKSVCFACHAVGAAGSPKYGDKAAWAPFIATGIDTMVKNAIHGVGAMPPRGGSQATDAQMHAAVEYMVHAAK